ncbi:MULTISPECIES: ABC transporter permease [Halocynthiibacter]|uniref:Transport permease protein n=1 Tax=Halocynthiibacter halioticoli TaxID=2986804 RepID=A0AAE3IWG0_9RHOB|nr:MULTISPECIES: ABC transporter permease [Halocynthiibacter]MCV6822979.1 ABC transporter permease [Halocynthiibacter halioticoli]MCW4055980.1 ABC transporter permease [Halocynthiibacter sp. SDUM655004]MDE0591450.1 ABC transporter permease [Halocynthiibacter sp. C4]
MISPRRIAAVLKKELLQLRRDRMTFAMVIMIPLIQLMLFGYAINTNLRHVPVALVDQAETELSRTLAQIVQATQVVEFTEVFATPQEAEIAITEARVRAALIIPRDVDNRFARSPAIGLGLPNATDQTSSRPVAHWIVDGSDTMVASAIKSLRAMPLTEMMRLPPNRLVPTFEVTLYFNPEQRSAVNIVPGLVGVILTMTMILFTSAAIVRERERGNMEMLINTPVKSSEIMIGKIIPYIFAGLIQVAIILGLGHVLFDVPINGGLGALLVVTLLFIIASLSVGLVVSTLAKNQLQSMQMTVFILLPSILMSGFMFPFDGMPQPVQVIAQALPATHFMDMIRGVVLRDASLFEMREQILWMIGFTVFGLMAATLKFKKRLD